MEHTGRLPDVVVACVGGGSNAIGMFHPFVGDEGVKLVGTEAGGEVRSCGLNWILYLSLIRGPGLLLLSLRAFMVRILPLSAQVDPACFMVPAPICSKTQTAKSLRPTPSPLVGFAGIECCIKQLGWKRLMQLFVPFDRP